MEHFQCWFGFSLFAYCYGHRKLRRIREECILAKESPRGVRGRGTPIIQSEIASSGLAAAIGQSYLRGMATNFTPDEEVEITLLLWEYERDGNTAIDNFIRREPGLSSRMASGVLPVRVQQRIIEYMKKQKR